MNRAVLANVLRHLLFLFIIFKLITAISVGIKSKDCLNKFEESWMVPLTVLKKITDAIQKAVEFFSLIADSIAFLNVIMSLIGFLGAIYVKKHLINFSVGCAFLFMAITEFFLIICLIGLGISLNELIDKEITQLFTKSNGYKNLSSNPTSREYMIHFMELWDNDGWPIGSKGTALEHKYIDFIQTAEMCCGLDGRLFWNMKMPMSCCDSSLISIHCKVMNARQEGCIRDFSNYKNCHQTLTLSQCFCAIFSVAIAACSIRLHRLRHKHSNDHHTIK